MNPTVMKKVRPYLLIKKIDKLNKIKILMMKIFEINICLILFLEIIDNLKFYFIKMYIVVFNI